MLPKSPVDLRLTDVARVRVLGASQQSQGAGSLGVDRLLRGVHIPCKTERAS